MIGKRMASCRAKKSTTCFRVANKPLDLQDLGGNATLLSQAGDKVFRIESITYGDYWTTIRTLTSRRGRGMLYDPCPLAPVVEANMDQQARLVVLMEIAACDPSNFFRHLE
jgi:hypothetical protein